MNSQLAPHHVMSLGGDGRIIRDDVSGLNGYGCAPFPHYSLPYSSCTSNSISRAAYDHVSAMWHSIGLAGRPDNVVASAECELIREGIHSHYGLGDRCDIVLGSSGTDLELVPLALAHARGDGRVHNIVVGHLEVGSGIEHAARGCHFASLSPSGNTVQLGQPLESLASADVSVALIVIRERNGTARASTSVASDIAEEIRRARRQRRHGIVHIVHQSKTGMIVPGVELTEALVADCGPQTLVVVDACQGRISAPVAHRYLDCGAAVLMTGSKFLSGPPFSGALLVPRNWEVGVKDRDGLAGLWQYFSRPEYPPSWKWLDECLAADVNWGLILRWHAALFEMRRWRMVPDDQARRIADDFHEVVSQAIDGSSDWPLCRVPTAEVSASDANGMEDPFGAETIVTFGLGRDQAGRALSFGDAKRVHRLMYSNLSSEFGGSDGIASVPIQLGQPVKIAQLESDVWSGHLRIALNSALICDLSVLPPAMAKARLVSDVDRIVKKLTLVRRRIGG